jgi:hypothetical protein
MDSNKVGAFVLIALGVVLLMTNLGWLSFRMVWRLFSDWWPLILIAMGVGMLIKPNGVSSSKQLDKKDDA